MADNFPFTPGSGSTGAAKDIAGVLYPKVIATESDGTDTAVGPKLGSVTETAPASDTASSGLNGRLQRIAQRLTSLIALLPGSIGQKANATSIAVAGATDDPLTVAIGSKTDNKSTATDTTSVSGISLWKQI